jgi:hypothetical protein
LQDQAGAERRYEGTDLQPRNEHAVDEPDDGRNREHRDHSHEHHLGPALHDERGEHRADADQIGDRKVDRSREDDEGLSDRHDPQRDHALQETNHALDLEHPGLPSRKRDADIKHERAKKQQQGRRWGAPARKAGGNNLRAAHAAPTGS